MPTITSEEKLQGMLDDFATSNFPDDSDAKARLEAVVYSSPELKDQLLKSIDEGNLLSITALPTGTNAGADYSPDTKIIRLNPDSFLTDEESTKYATIFQLGHEIQHGEVNIERANIDQKRYDDFIALYQIGTDYDVTNILNETLDFNYKDEAQAMLAGWNAVVNGLRNDPNKDVSLANLIDIGFGYDEYFFEELPDDNGNRTFQLKEGLTLNDDLTVTINDANTKALEETYSKQSGEKAGLGQHGEGSYTDYYMSGNLGWMCENHTLGWLEQTPPLTDPPKLSVDFDNLGQGTTPQSIQDAGMLIRTQSNECSVYDTKDPDQPIIFHDQGKLEREATDALDAANKAIEEAKEAQEQAKVAQTEADEARKEAELAEKEAQTALEASRQEPNLEKTQHMEVKQEEAQTKGEEADAKSHLAEAKTIEAYGKITDAMAKVAVAEIAVDRAGTNREELVQAQDEVDDLNKALPIVKRDINLEQETIQDSAIDLKDSKDEEQLLPDGSVFVSTGDKDLDDFFKAFYNSDKEGMDAAVESIEQSEFGLEIRMADEALYQFVLTERTIEQLQREQQEEIERQQQNAQEQMQQQQLDNQHKSPSLER